MSRTLLISERGSSSSIGRFPLTSVPPKFASITTLSLSLSLSHRIKSSAMNNSGMFSLLSRQAEFQSAPLNGQWIYFRIHSSLRNSLVGRSEQRSTVDGSFTIDTSVVNAHYSSEFRTEIHRFPPRQRQIFDSFGSNDLVMIFSNNYSNSRHSSSDASR